MKVKAKVLKYMLSENEVKKQVKDYLNLKGYFHYPNLQGLGAYKGIPDRIAIKNGRVLFIEVKKPGAKQSVNQLAFQSEIWQHGGHYILVKCLDDLIKSIDEIEGR